MTQLQPTLLSNAPAQNDRILQSTSGNANFQAEGECTDHPTHLQLDDSSEFEGDAPSDSKPSRTIGYTYGARASRHANVRSSVREAKQTTRRRHCHVSRRFSPFNVSPLSVGPTGLPSNYYEATYKPRGMKGSVDPSATLTKIQPVPEAIDLSHPQNRERYLQYLSRPRKDTDKNGNTVWTHVAEEAFQEAVRRVPPVLGKKKIAFTKNNMNSLRGRNELIAEVIFRLTGEIRCRKQISSHMQVLKNFVSQADARMGPESAYPTAAEVKMFKDANPQWEECASTRTWKWDDVNLMLVCTDMYTETGIPAIKSDHQLRRHDILASLPYRSTGPLLSSLDCVIQRMDFNMTLFVTDDRSETSEVVHKFTTTQSEAGAQTRSLDEDWCRFFPMLQTYLAQGSIERCDLVMLESSLSILKGDKASEAKLGISFNVDFQGREAFDHISVRSTFYQNIGEEMETRSRVVSHKQISPHDCGRFRLFDIPMRASMWAELFRKILNKRKRLEVNVRDAMEKLQEASNSDQGRLLIDAEKQARLALTQEDGWSERYLQKMSVMQEVSGWTTNDKGEWNSKVVSIFLWRFRSAQPGEMATTTWRRLNNPLSQAGGSQMPVAPECLPTNFHKSHIGHENYALHQNHSQSTAPADSFSSSLDWDQDWTDIHLDSFAPRSEENQPSLNHSQPVFKETYPKPPQIHYKPLSSTVPSNDHYDSGYNSQPSSFSSQFSSQHPFVQHNDQLPSQALNQRINEFLCDEQQHDDNYDPYSSLVNTQIYNDEHSRYSLDSHNCGPQQHCATQLLAQDSFDMSTVTDPDLLQDFSGGHIVLNLYNSQQQEDHLSESHSNFMSTGTSLPVNSANQSSNNRALIEKPQVHGVIDQPDTSNSSQSLPRTPANQIQTTSLDPSSMDGKGGASDGTQDIASLDSVVDESLLYLPDRIQSQEDWYPTERTLRNGPQGDYHTQRLVSSPSASAELVDRCHTSESESNDTWINRLLAACDNIVMCDRGMRDPSTSLGRESREDYDYLQMLKTDIPDALNMDLNAGAVSTLEACQSILARQLEIRPLSHRSPVSLADHVNLDTQGEYVGPYYNQDGQDFQPSDDQGISQDLSYDQEHATDTADVMQLSQNILWSPAAIMTALHPTLFMDIGAGPGPGPLPLSEGRVLGEVSHSPSVQEQDEIVEHGPVVRNTLQDDVRAIKPEPSNDAHAIRELHECA